MEDLTSLFAEEEARRLAEARAEIAKEKAVYDALSPEQKAAKNAEYEAKYAHFDDLVEADETEEDDEE